MTSFSKQLVILANLNESVFKRADINNEELASSYSPVESLVHRNQTGPSS